MTMIRTTLVDDLIAAALSKAEIASLNRQARGAQGQQVLYLHATVAEAERFLKSKGVAVGQIASVRNDEWCAVRLGLRDLFKLSAP